MSRLWLSCFALLPSLVFAAVMHPMDVIDPIGDENLGYIQVVTPPERDPSMPEIVPAALSLIPQNIAVSANKAQRILEGNYTLKIDIGSSYGGMTSVNRAVAVTKKQTTTIQLAGLNVNWRNAPLQTDVGPQVKVTVTAANTGFAAQFDPTTAWNYYFPGGHYLYAPVFADDFSVNYGPITALGAIQFALKPGEVRTVDLQAPDLRAKVEVAPVIGVFPDATNTDQCQSGIFMVERTALIPNAVFHIPLTIYGGGNNTSGLTGMRSYAVRAISTGAQFKFFPSADGKQPAIYELVVNNTWMPIAASVGQTLTIPLKRIDVNDVLVTRENGSTYMATGSYQIFVQGLDPKKDPWTLLKAATYQSRCEALHEIQTFRTRTGLTVLPNIYKVVVTYGTEEGTKTTEQVVDLR